MKVGLVITSLVVLVAAHAAAAASACDDAARTAPVRLVAAHSTANEEQTATQQEMDDIADQLGASRAIREAHPLMLSVAQAGAHVELDHHTIVGHDPEDRAYVCDVPTSVTVIIGAFKTRVILDRNAADAPCVRKALVEHHIQHSHTLDAKIDLFVDEHRDSIANNVRELMRTPKQGREPATQAFEAGIAALVGGLYREFESVIEQSRQEVDTPSELNQLREACDGQVKQLERELVKPEGRRVSREGSGRTLRIPQKGHSAALKPHINGG